MHLIFRRTKAVKERIVFEVDEYDFHFVNRNDAINNQFVWKINLLGGGRIASLVAKSQVLNTFEEYLKAEDCISMEGYQKGSRGKMQPDYMYELNSLPTSAITSRGIDYKQLESIPNNTVFSKVPQRLFFESPNVILWENMGAEKLPVFLNTRKSFSFKDKIISLKSKTNDLKILQSIVKNFETNSDFYRFFIFCTSSQVLVNLNSAILKKDYMTLPYVEDRKGFFSQIDLNIIDDVNTYYQDFLRHGERSVILDKLEGNELKNSIELYGIEYCKLLNDIQNNQKQNFKIYEVCELYDSTYICIIFKYSSASLKNEISWKKDGLEEIESLSNFQISSRLNSQRIVRYYHSDNTIVIVKPNQKRYWLSHKAYRDADKTLIDLVKNRN